MGTSRSKLQLPPPDVRQQSPILLVEDDEDDIFFAERLLLQAGIENPVTVARDVHAAKQCLVEALQAGAPLPCIVICDIKLPGRTGFELLQWVRRHNRLRSLAVVMLSASDLPVDRAMAQKLGADAYAVKPPSKETFVPMLLRLSRRVRLTKGGVPDDAAE